MTIVTARPSDPFVQEPATHATVWPALARREARFTLRHPVVWLGILASLYLLWSFNRNQVPHLAGYSTFVGLGLAPLAGAALLVAHLHTSRARRHGTLEIEEPAPARERARTFGHLVGSLAVVPVAAVIVIIYMVYLSWLGGTGSIDAGELLVGPAVVAIAGVAGVAAGTWIPNRFGGLIALGLVAAVQIAFQDATGTLHWFAWWHTVLWYGGFDLWIRPTWAHVAYLVGGVALLGAVTSLRHGFRIAPTTVAGAGLALVLAGGAVQYSPPGDAEIEQRWDHIVNPARYWVTIPRDDATYHVHPSYQAWVDWWDSVISDTLAPISVEDRPAIVVEQWHHPFASQVIDEFGWEQPKAQALIQRANGMFFGPRGDDPWPMRVGDTLYQPERAALAIAAAQRAVGLPLMPVEVEGRPFTEAEIEGFLYEPDDASEYVAWPGRERGLPRPVLGDRWILEVSCDPEGQAREVVAAWLAAQADPSLADLYRDIRLHGPSSTLDGGDALAGYAPDDAESTIPIVQWGRLSWMQHGGYGGGNGADAVAGSPTATDLAAQLLERPPAEVAAAIRAHWDTWTDPATPIEVLVDEFDLEPPPTPEEWIERGGLDPDDYAASITIYPRWIGDDLLGNQPYPACP